MTSKFFSRLPPIVALLLCLSAPLHAQDPYRFVLTCTGSVHRVSGTNAQRVGPDMEFRRLYYIDLWSSAFCLDVCSEPFALRRIDQDTIDLSWQIPSDGSIAIGHSNGRTTYDRNSGEFQSDENQSGTTFYQFRLDGQCETEPLVTWPIIQFLARPQ